MESRIYSEETLYPFTPAAEPYRAYLKGVLDCLMVIRGPLSASSPASVSPYLKLVSIAITGIVSTYLFNAVSHDGVRILSFSVTAGSGIVRVSSGFSTMVVNSDTMFTGAGVYLMDAEVEPARVCWQTDEVTGIRLVNEERKFDPGTRGSLSNTVLAQFTSDGDVVELVDGYNCELSYDKTSKTLFIQASPGLGKGLPSALPWNNAAPNITAGIRTVNGINANGNVNIVPGPSLARPVG